MSRLALFFLTAALLPAAPPYKERWVTKYFFDEEASTLTITDLQFPSPRRGIASGFITRPKDKPRPLVLVTSDAGEHWTTIPVKEIPQSLFFLDDGTGWMVGEKNLWKTEESGRAWLKLKGAPEDLLRVWFTSRTEGFAIAERKQVFRTSDGGVSWMPLDIAATPKISPETSTYNVIAFAGQSGIIAGWNNPPRRGETPNWIDPAKARNRPQWPTTIALLQTFDAGKTWNASTASIFGHLSRISLNAAGESLGVVEFNDQFAYPSEVYLASKQSGGKNERIFRQANRFITDALLFSNGAGFLAGVEAVGTIRNSPIPGKLKIFNSPDGKTWSEMPVDYRAEGHRAILASPDPDNVWVATDTGMILKLVRE